MGYTRKPCPACGEVDFRRKKDDICSSCRRELEFAKEMREHFAGEAKKEHMLVCYGMASHWNAYFNFHTFGAGGGLGRELQDAFFELAESLRTPYTGPLGEATYLLGGNKQSSPVFGSAYAMLIPTRLADAIMALHGLIQPSIDAAYEIGKEHGLALLKGLASGEMSEKDFNAKVAR